VGLQDYLLQPRIEIEAVQECIHPCHTACSKRLLEQRLWSTSFVFLHGAARCQCIEPLIDLFFLFGWAGQHRNHRKADQQHDEEDKDQQHRYTSTG